MEELTQFVNDANMSGILQNTGGILNFGGVLSDVSILVYALPILIAAAFAVRLVLWALLSGVLGFEGAKLVSLVATLFTGIITAAVLHVNTVLAYTAGITRSLIN